MIHLKNKHLFLAFASFILILSLIFSLYLCNVKYLVSSGEEYKSASTCKAIILDAGHGGFDGGAIGINGTIEKNINLDICLILRDMLDDAGYTVILTRDKDTALDDEGCSSTRSKKISDIHNRLKLTQLYPDSLLVSIHQNKLEGSQSVHGGQIFYSPSNPSSKLLAEQIQSEFNSAVNGTKQRNVVKAGKNLYLFYHAKNTSVLCECGFLSNPEEEALLNTKDYQIKIAYCIYRGILQYFESPALDNN